MKEVGPNRHAKRVPKTITAADAVFVYISTCCSAAAEKPACAIAKGQRIGELHRREARRRSVPR